MSKDQCCKLDSICEEHLIKALGAKNTADLSKVQIVNISQVQQGMKIQFDLFNDGRVPEEALLAAIKWMGRNGHILINGEPPVYLISDK